MKQLLFVPLTKVDLVKREVWGVASEEVKDKSGEIMDYASSKPNFVKWSESFEKATEGKSKGNVREMHGKSAAGKLSVFECNDVEKRFEVCAKVVDDAAWKKVVEGVYTGFSVGGSYAKRWPDPNDSSLIRYTADPSEVSLVDNPCVPTATFTMVKADGLEEQVEFKGREIKSLRKGLYGVQDLARVVSSLQWCAEDARVEAMVEGDGSEIPGKLKEAVKILGAILVQMVQEEVSELTPEDTMTEAEKTQFAEMEKMIKEMKEKLDKAAPAPAPVEKVETEAEKMAKTIAELTERLDKVEAQPAAPAGAKPVVLALDKSQDGAVANKALDPEKPLDLIKMAHEKPKFLSKADLGDYLGVAGARAN